MNYEELGRWGCGLLCLVGQLDRYTHTNRVIDLVFDTLTHRAGPISRELDCFAVVPETRPHETTKSSTHTSRGNKPHMRPWLLWQGQHQKPSILLPHLHDLNRVWKSLASFHLFIWLQMNTLELNTRFFEWAKRPACFRCFCYGASHLLSVQKNCVILFSGGDHWRVRTPLWLWIHSPDQSYVSDFISCHDLTV